MGKEKIIKIGMIDDHDLLRKGICDFIRDDDNFEIVFEAENGKLALKKNGANGSYSRYNGC